MNSVAPIGCFVFARRIVVFWVNKRREYGR
jgi:hypothetical protein